MKETTKREKHKVIQIIDEICQQEKKHNETILSRIFKEIRNLTDAELDSFNDNVIDDDETITIDTAANSLKTEANEWVENIIAISYRNKNNDK